MKKKIYNFRSRVLRPSLDSNYSQQNLLENKVDTMPNNSPDKKKPFEVRYNGINSYPAGNKDTRLNNIGDLVNIYNQSPCQNYCKSICKKEINDICGLRNFIIKYPDYRRYI
jgi:hypothetical protein